jgi:hypothetical protein
VHYCILLFSSYRVCYYSVQELQIVLFFCSGAARYSICFSSVHELQGMLIFYSGISGFAILLFRSCKVCYSLFRSCRVCYSCLECGLEFRRKELGQGIREVGLAHGRIVGQVEGRH